MSVPHQRVRGEGKELEGRQTLISHLSMLSPLLSQEGNLSQRQMAVWLGCHQSTISRELRRNQSFLSCYLPNIAQAESETCRKNAKQPFKNVSESALELVK
jgi:IS30 family transposase